MIGPERTCKSCGHDCHCYAPDCKDCVNDVCTRCDCKEEQKKPSLQETDARSWNGYFR